MKFFIQTVLFAVLATVIAAASVPDASEELLKRQGCIGGTTVFFPDPCPAGTLACNSAGSITLCCSSC
ncbi:hypothetical protein K435DRAFT_773619 [Dendrothele bispora CBS 962.96]|uniref:Uncharacterized protein n=1 Tax=Dendrothele bispora (strain CBS 962.96) TaxID=1314807 RepID=A0A4S8MSA5_DENBC|nr:hypothetical protein K435DRAFT_773619 [Dendrothele bispora CBS 962.96]